MTRHALVRSVFGVLLVFTACARSAGPKPSASPSPGASAAEVVATIDGKPIRGQELDAKVERRLSRLRQEEYEIRSQALEEMIGERLLETEARTRGITTEGLLHDEVLDRLLVGQSQMDQQFSEGPSGELGLLGLPCLRQIRRGEVATRDEASSNGLFGAGQRHIADRAVA